MKHFITKLIIWLNVSLSVMSQNIYLVSDGKIILQSAMVGQNSDGLNTHIRFSAAFHAGEYVHYGKKLENR